MATLAEKRRQLILKAMRSKGDAAVSDLAQKLSVSEMTVRRDLHLLEQQGLLRRVHGGAVAAPGVRFGERLATNSAGKAAAARKLVRFIPRNGSIYLDGSTTMLNLVEHLGVAQDLQVATNNVETFRRLGPLPGVQPLLIGGRLDVRTDNLVGALAMRSILAIVFDAAFFSSYGITPEHGPMEATVEDAEVKDLVASRSGSVLLAVDCSKLGVTASGAWLPDGDKTTLATDLSPRDCRLSGFRRRFGRIL